MPSTMPFLPWDIQSLILALALPLVPPPTPLGALAPPSSPSTASLNKDRHALVSRQLREGGLLRLVCRDWETLATPLIYRRVSLASVGGGASAAGGGMLRLLETTPRLAGLVRSLEVQPGYAAEGQGQLESTLSLLCGLEDLRVGERHVEWSRLNGGTLGRLRSVGTVHLQDGQAGPFLQEESSQRGLQELALEVTPRAEAAPPGPVNPSAPPSPALHLPRSLTTLLYSGPLSNLISSSPCLPLLRTLHLTPSPAAPDDDLAFTSFLHPARTLQHLSLPPLAHPLLLSAVLTLLEPKESALPALQTLRFSDMSFGDGCRCGRGAGRKGVEEGGLVEGWDDVLREVAGFGRERGWEVMDSEERVWKDCEGKTTEAGVEEY